MTTPEEADMTARLAVLSEKVNRLDAEHEELKVMLRGLAESTSRIERELGRYKGVIGGLTMVLAGVAFVASIFGDWIAAHISWTH